MNSDSEEIQRYKLKLKNRNIIVDRDFFKRFFNLQKPRSCILRTSDYDLISQLAADPEILKEVCKNDLIDDISFLEKKFPYCYGGYSVFENRGLKWAKVFENWKRQINKLTPQISVNQAILPFESSFEHLIDNHLQFIFLKKRQKKTSVTIIGNKKVPGFTCHTRTVFRKNKLVNLPVSVGPISCLNSSIDKVTHDAQFHNQKINDFHPHNKIGLRSTKDYTYFRIPTFTSDVASQLQKIKINKRKDFFGPLIIDVRSNKGLSNIKVVQLINQLADVQNNPEFLSYFDTHLKSNRYTTTLADNFDLFFLLHNKTDKSRLDLREVIKKNLETPTIKKSKTIINNSRPVFVLINRFVSSDGEALLKYLMNFKNKVVLGENTGGCCEFVEPGLLILPKTKLPLFVPRGHNRIKNIDYPSLDGYGFAPDIYLDKDKWNKEDILSCIQNIMKTQGGIFGD